MIPEELAQALSGESERVEWKQSNRDASELLSSLAALANDLEDSRKPGYVVIGRAKNGTDIGVEERSLGGDEEIQQLVNRLTSTRILPTPTFVVERVARGERVLWVLRIEPYPVPPVVSVDGTPWVRKGSTTRRATEADLLRLRERRPENLQPFDTRPLHGASLSDLRLPTLRPQYEAAREDDGSPDTFPSFERWLVQRELGREVNTRFVPLVAAVLLHGLSPQSFLPGAIVEMVRYAGLDVTAPVAWRRTVTGSLPDQLETLWAQLSAHLAEVSAGAAGMINGYAPEYPLDALRELARNLVQHRLYEGTNAPARVEWYDDRIVFTNPGGPFGRATEGEFGEHADYRNPAVTRGLAGLGYVERLGRGIRLVRSLLTRNGNPPLEHATDGYLTVTVRRRP
jgi:ATP-dependent DNA helicase RecG